MTIELLFDSYERLGEPDDMDSAEMLVELDRRKRKMKTFESERRDKSVEPDIRALEEMSSVQDPESRHEARRRPHHCIVAWGSSRGGMRPFRCVIESLVVKYTMWDHTGLPVRATCTVTLKEAHKMVGAQAAKEEYDEKRRGPDWDRKKAAAYDSMSQKEYMEYLARKLDRSGKRPPESE